MPEEIRVRQQQQPMQQPQYMHQMQGEMDNSSKSSSKMPWVILAIIVVVLIVLGVLFRGSLFKGSGSEAMMAPSATSGASGYQAVFLTNGQVYFGKISNPDGDYVTLDNIFYLQVGPQQGSGTTGASASSSQQSISLVKLGNELHGPVDEMHISRSQILFYEDLKSDGQVVKAIEAYKANPTGAAPNPAK